MAAKVLIIGNGSREHALAWKISQSEEVREIYISPGNAGTCLVGKCVNVDLELNDFESVANWCKDQHINLTVVGPEVYLADGLSDILNSYGIPCFGPRKHAAQIESSKWFSKQFMDKYGIPTACWKSFTNAANAIDYINKSNASGLVVKASGLAAGKGVVVTADKEEAIQAVLDIMKDKKFGEAGNTIIIEEKLEGEEISVFAFSDGKDVAVFPPAQDYKRAYDNDKGPNTGGMGAYCPVFHVSEDILQYVNTNVIQTTIHGLQKEGHPFVGLLYAGLMLTQDGPKVLEFNCRFGDPETQVVLPLLSSDLYVIMKSCCNGSLHNTPVKFYKDKSALTVVLASGGYPENYQKGMVISDLKEVENVSDVMLFHAGTKLDNDRILTNGGRVMSVTSVGSKMSEARKKCYNTVSKISFTDMFYRRDIALKTIGTEKTGLTYLDAGVDIEAGTEFVDMIKPLALQTTRAGCMTGLGGFGALFDLKVLGYKDPILVSGTDGVGTKLKICHEISDHSSVGIDLVAMCVNDILAQGAEPLFFLDYYACGKLNKDSAKQVIAGISNGCMQAGCGLLGGETAEMPGMYSEDVYDIAGFAVGIVERCHLLPNLKCIQPDDVVIGLASSGIHSNGFSLVRKIVDVCGLTYSDKCPFRKDELTLGEALLVPTKVYVGSVLPLIKDGLIKAFAHITGGGLVENIPRVLPKGVGCLLDAHKWKIPTVFAWLADIGNVNSKDMLKTFNCGLGGIAIVSKDMVGAVLERLNREGELACSVGVLTRINDGQPQVDIQGFESSLQMLIKKANIWRLDCVKPKKQRMKVGVLISGNGTNLQALIDQAMKRDSWAEIVLVVSNVENAYGLRRAEKAGIKTKVISHKNFKKRLDFDMEVLKALKEVEVELVCLAGFMRILTGEFVREWRGKLINIHPSLLPSFKGINAHEQVIKAGVRITGCTAHFVVEEVDAGGIIEQAAVPVYQNDTVETLGERVKLKEWEVFPKAMEMVASRSVTVKK